MLEEYAILPLSSRLKGKLSKKLAKSRTTCFIRVSCLAYPSALETEATFSSKMYVNFQWSTQNYTPEDGTHHVSFVVF